MEKTKRGKGRPIGSWTKWPPERIEQALDLIRKGYNYTQAAEAVGAKRHQLTNRLRQTGRYIPVSSMRLRWQSAEVLPGDDVEIIVTDGLQIAIARVSQLHGSNVTHWMHLPELP